MSTPAAVVVDPRFKAGDRYMYDGCEPCGLVRDRGGRWRTSWRLWMLSDQHLTEDGDRLYEEGPGVWRTKARQSVKREATA